MKPARAVVLLSGGLDSATCLYLAKEEGFAVDAISFDYGQRHRNELKAAAKIAAMAGAKHTVVSVDLRAIGGSALTSGIEVPKGGSHLGAEGAIPVTYVPMRNMIFLSLAYALAETRSAEAVFIGVNAIDYSGYPDCRPDFIASFSQTAALASKSGREGHAPQLKTPLISLSKADIALAARRLAVPIADTWSCYDPQTEGSVSSPCRECDACLLRRDGFAATGLEFTAAEIFGSPIALA